jgi:hypothetical protein
MKWLELTERILAKNRQRMELTPPPQRRTLAPIGAGLSAANAGHVTRGQDQRRRGEQGGVRESVLNGSMC